MEGSPIDLIGRQVWAYDRINIERMSTGKITDIYIDDETGMVFCYVVSDIPSLNDITDQDYPYWLFVSVDELMFEEPKNFVFLSID